MHTSTATYYYYYYHSHIILFSSQRTAIHPTLRRGPPLVPPHLTHPPNERLPRFRLVQQLRRVQVLYTAATLS